MKEFEVDLTRINTVIERASVVITAENETRAKALAFRRAAELGSAWRVDSKAFVMESAEVTAVHEAPFFRVVDTATDWRGEPTQDANEALIELRTRNLQSAAESPMTERYFAVVCRRKDDPQYTIDYFTNHKVFYGGGAPFPWDKPA